MAIKLEGGDDEDLDLAGDGPTNKNPNLPDFGVGGNIFGTPGGLLSGVTTIGADGGTPGGLPFGTNAGYDLVGGDIPFGNIGVDFSAPSTTFRFGSPGSMSPENMSLGDLINPYNQRTDISQLNPNWGIWNPSTDFTTAKEPDLSGVKLAGTPFRNVGIDQNAITGTTPSINAGSDVSTTAADSGAVQLDPFVVSEGKIPGTLVNLSDIYTPGPTAGNALLGGVSTSAPGTTLVMDPFQVTTSRLPTATLNLSQPTQGTTIAGTGPASTSDVTTLPAVTVTGTKVNEPSMSSQDMIDLLNKATTAWGQQPVQLPPVTATTATSTATTSVTPVSPNISPTQTNPPTSVFIPPQVTVPTTTTTTPTNTLPPTGQPSGGTTQTGTATPTTTTSTSSAMTERDLDKELEKTMAAFNKYRPQIQQMYGDLYSQFMPKGLTAAEPGVINQYQQDLARLQQRQAGMLSPEDVRQSQQAAREAYGARGQVMGRGAVGAEILNREAIRQQREDQARQALQQSYGNILNMSNLQTGNIFSPIASLMSGTFNPMGSYPADVYGTNVNAQLAREITQRNNEAAIRAAELTGSAAKSASNTSLIGDLLKVGGSVKIVLACMPGDQPIDTPVGPVAVKNLKGGDKVVGYDGSVVQITQVSSYVQDADRDFFTFHLSNGGKITVCDRHKIMDIPASEWVVGAAMGDAVVERIDRKNGVTTSYDLVTEVGGYRIAGVPVNSMIPEMLAATLQLVALKHAL